MTTKTTASKLCPNCTRTMTPGFINASDSIRVMPSDVVAKWFHTNANCDLLEVPFWKKLLHHAAQYVRAHQCPDCELVLIEYGQSLTSDQAKDLAAEDLQNTSTSSN